MVSRLLNWLVPDEEERAEFIRVSASKEAVSVVKPEQNIVAPKFRANKGLGFDEADNISANQMSNAEKDVIRRLPR